MEHEVYDAVGGADGMLRLASAWHERVMADEVVSHAFSHGIHPEHTARLAAYWAEALGGPATYSQSYGDETSVVVDGHGEREASALDVLEHRFGGNLTADRRWLQVIDLHPHADGGDANRQAIGDRRDRRLLAQRDHARGRQDGY